MSELKPGKYLVGPNGVEHGYNEMMAKQPGVRVMVVDGGGQQKDQGVLLEPSLHQKLVGVMREMPSMEGNMDLYTVEGIPRIDYLSGRVGSAVNAAARNAAWEEIRPIDVTMSASAA